jgi:hypothetical protein
LKTFGFLDLVIFKKIGLDFVENIFDCLLANFTFSQQKYLRFFHAIIIFIDFITSSIFLCKLMDQTIQILFQTIGQSFENVFNGHRNNLLLWAQSLLIFIS